jgi:mono/diheme cytochrome c family protein
MKRSSLLLLIGIALFGVVIAIAVSILHDGLSSRATPTAVEAALARNLRHLAIPSNVRSAQNPLLDSAEDLRDARFHFADHCAVCHANDGSGDTTFGAGLYPKPPDLRLPPTQDLTDGELFWIIENGVRFTGMPAFSGPDHGSQTDSWKLVHFIRHLPHLTPAERIEMEEYNPKGRTSAPKKKRKTIF